MLLPTLVLHSTFPSTRVSAPTPTKAAAYDVVEFTVAAGMVPIDPFAAEIDGTFTNGATRLVLPAFWDGKAFRLRFCPTKPGEWTLRVGGAEPCRFRIAPSKSPGFVHPSPANPRYFATDDGRGYVPIGLNLCWPDRDGLASYDRRFAKLRSVGGDFARVWTTQERRVETGLGTYSEPNAAFYDGVFRLAVKHGVRTMLTLDDYRVLAKTDYFNAHWADSPYNAKNGGPLREPTDFFADPLSRRLYKRRLRYLVARYAAFPSLAFWEIYNEQDNIPEPGVPTAWFREMTDYLASIDPYHHPITTSYSWRDRPEVWRSPALGLTQRHLYGQGDTVDFVSMIEENARKLDAYGKPRLIGEFGITWKEADVALDKARLGTPLHDALWASIMSGDAGGALTWWWDGYLEPLDLWPVFTGISRFVAPIDFAHRDFRPLKTLPLGGGEGGGAPLTALGLRDASIGETLLWLHDPASNWQNDAKGAVPREWVDAAIRVPATRRMTAEAWDTRTGGVVRRATVTPREGAVTVGLPPFRRDIAVRLR